MERSSADVLHVQHGILKNSLSAPVTTNQKTCQLDENGGDKLHQDDDQHKHDDGDNGKHVLFAEDCACELIEVQDFVENNENTDLWSTCVHFQGKGLRDRKCRDGSLSEEGFEREPELAICFSDPCTDNCFMEGFQERRIALERCRVRDRNVLGVILVRHIDEEKSTVIVRYTMDKWATQEDISAKYIPNFSDVEVSHYVFVISLPKDSFELEFCVSYKLSDTEYWDNNSAENYKIQDIQYMIGLDEI